MTSSVVSARVAAERKTPSSLFIISLLAALGLALAFAVSFGTGIGIQAGEDSTIIVQGP